MTDRELVVNCAEKVMGWRVHCRNTAHWVDARLEHSAGALDYVVRAQVNHWNPLASDDDAFMLVDMMAAQFCFSLASSAGWVAQFEREANGRVESFQGVGKDRCRAIVRAALRAVGVEVQCPR